MGLQPPKSLKLVIFGINFPKKGIPLKRFLQNLAWGGRPRFAPSCQIVSLSVKKCGSTAPIIAKICIFLYKFAQQGYTPLRSQFYNILPGGERFPGPHSHGKFHCYSFKNVALRPPKSPKMVIFGINLPIMGKFKGFIEKLDYRCTTTNLPLCNGTIIVLKITLLHSVSVNINFIIPKRDKRQTKKRHTFSSTAGALSMIPTILGTGGPCHICTPLTFSEPIRSFPAKGYL